MLGLIRGFYLSFDIRFIERYIVYYLNLTNLNLSIVSKIYRKSYAWKPQCIFEIQAQDKKYYEVK